MEIDIKYKLFSCCWIMKDNKPTEFTLRAMKAECVYAGYSGEYWGDESAGAGRGWPIVVYYSDTNYGEQWIPQSKVFESKEALINSLL